MFTSRSSIPVNNQIRPSRIRQPGFMFQSVNDFKESCPVNIGRISNSTIKPPNLSLKKSIKRSKEVHVTRIATRPSGPLTTNQQSLIRPNYNSSTLKNLSTENLPHIHQRSSHVQITPRPPLTKQSKIPIPADSGHQSLPKIKPAIPKADQPTNNSLLISTNTHPVQISYTDCFKQLTNTIIHWQESEEVEEYVPIVMDEVIQEAIIKCADWLIKYVFDKNYDEDDE